MRTLDSITDAVGKGQDTILQALGDRLLRGTNAGLSRNAWANVAIIAREPGSTLGELRDYFARTPDARIVMNTQTWHAMIANGVSNDFLHVRTTSGEENPTGYDASWQVWAKGHEPKPKTGALAPTTAGRPAAVHRAARPMAALKAAAPPTRTPVLQRLTAW